MFSISHNQKADYAVDSNDSVVAFVKILAHRMMRDRQRVAEELESDDELDFQVKKLSERAGSDIFLAGGDSEDEEKFVLEEEENEEKFGGGKDSSHGGFRNYSVTQELQDSAIPSYKAFTTEGVPIKTFYHANTFNEKLTKSRRKIPLGPKKEIGSVQEISLSTTDETPFKNYQSCKLIQISNSLHSCQPKRVTVKFDFENEDEDLQHSAIKVSNFEDEEKDAIEFDRESYLSFNLNKSCNIPSLGYSPREIYIGMSPLSNILSPYGDSPTVFNHDEFNIGFTQYTSTVHCLPNSPPIMIGGQQSHPETPVSVCLAKKTDLELVEMNQSNLLSSAIDSEMIYTHKQIQKTANADVVVPKPLMKPYQKAPVFNSFEKKDAYCKADKSIHEKMRPRQTTLVEDELKVNGPGFVKPPTSITKSTTVSNKASARRTLTPQIQGNGIPVHKPQTTKPVLVEQFDTLIVPEPQKKLIKWASQEILGQPTAADVCSPSRRNGGIFQRTSISFLPHKIPNKEQVEEKVTVKLNSSQSNSTLKNLLSSGPIKKYIDQKSRDSKSLLHKSTSLNLDPKILSSKKKDKKSTPQFFTQMFESVTRLNCNPIPVELEESAQPKSLDLLTDKPAIELVACIKQILIENNLDPFTVVYL